MFDFHKFKEKLLGNTEFYSSLKGECINNKEFQHVLKVWNKWKSITICTYELHLLYLT